MKVSKRGILEGRPTAMTPEVIGKLEEAFSKGFTDSQACLYANIANSTLYDYCLSHPRFSERKEALKNNPTLIAKNNIYNKIVQGDDAASKWWLERKAKDEFSLRSESTGRNGEPLQIVTTYIEKEEREEYERHIQEQIDED